MSSVDLDYAYKLASTLMFKRFGDENPTDYSSLAIKIDDRREVLSAYRVCGHWALGDSVQLIKDDDLWLYLSDLDILRVKG